MPTLPPSTDFTGSSVTQGGGKTYMGTLRTFISDLLGTDSGNKPAARAALGAAALGANSDITSLTALASINGGQIAGLRNRLINGAMGIDQRNAGAAQTITAAAALAYTVDRWYGYCTGANVTGQRVAGTAPNQYNYRYTGAASVTKIGHAQRIEAANCQDLAGTTATLSVDLANSLLTTVTWTAWRANSNDTFGTLASPTRTQIGTGAFTVNSTLAKYSAQITVPAAATTGIEVEFSVGGQTSGTFTLGRVQLEGGSVATPFEVRPLGIELALCQRFYRKVAGLGLGIAALAAGGFGLTWPVTMRATPTIANAAFTVGSGNAGTVSVLYVTADGAVVYNTGAAWTVSAGVAVSCELTGVEL